eukprot:6487897-Prymnesium_polylepis.1
MEPRRPMRSVSGPAHSAPIMQPTLTSEPNSDASVDVSPHGGLPHLPPSVGLALKMESDLDDSMARLAGDVMPSV